MKIKRVKEHPTQERGADEEERGEHADLIYLSDGEDTKDQKGEPGVRRSTRN